MESNPCSHGAGTSQLLVKTRNGAKREYGHSKKKKRERKKERKQKKKKRKKKEKKKEKNDKEKEKKNHQHPDTGAVLRKFASA